MGHNIAVKPAKKKKKSNYLFGSIIYSIGTHLLVSRFSNAMISFLCHFKPFISGKNKTTNMAA